MVCPPKRFGHMGNVKGEMYYGISAFFQKAIYSPDLVVSDQPLSGVRRYYRDGAVRSGKTLCLSLSFVAWRFRPLRKEASLCAVRRWPPCGAIWRGLWTALLTQLGVACSVREKRHEIRMKQAGRELIFYLFGGRDESSASLIQGMTLSGVLFDEVALMPRSFVSRR